MFLNENLNDAAELTTVREGEYKLRIMKAEMKAIQSTGSNCVNLMLDIPDEPLSKTVYHTLWMPKATDSPKERANTLGHIVTFLRTFGFDPAEDISNLEVLEGATGWAILVEKDEGEYGIKNKVKKFIPPKA